jgi:CubicO group peptidase (beta-lactamase class C family)
MMDQLLTVMAKHVGAGELPGAVLAVSSGSENRIEAVGDHLAVDSVVRISSMTKPLVAVLTHQLAQDGLLALSDPITRWLPELASQPVLRRLDGPVDDTVPAEHATTVEDLLTMKLGFGFAFEVESCPVAELASARGLGLGPPLPSAVPHRPDDFIQVFAELPLMEQPGRHWRYEFAYPVLGVLLARAASQPLPELLQERLLEPLGMADTGFVVPDHAQDRLVPCYTTGLEVFDGVADSDWLTPPLFPHAGGGLVSTAADYLRFGRLLLDGKHDDLTTDHLTEEQRNGPSAGIFLDGEGWGHGVQVRLDTSLPRRYGWGGGLGTTWYNFPDHDLTAVLLTQHVPPLAPAILDFWSALDKQLS